MCVREEKILLCAQGRLLCTRNRDRVQYLKFLLDVQVCNPCLPSPCPGALGAEEGGDNRSGKALIIMAGEVVYPHGEREEAVQKTTA